ncbi:MAG: hypothetical protein R3C05_01945 [Pirellulaceae bacterium]
MNQRQPAIIDGVPHSLGEFHLKADAQVRVTISNEDADGYVVVDGLQIPSIERASQERESPKPLTKT